MLAQRSNPSLQHQSQSHLRIDKLPKKKESLAGVRGGTSDSQRFYFCFEALDK